LLKIPIYFKRFMLSRRSNRPRLLDQPAHAPRLGLRERPALLDQHCIACLDLVLFVMYVVFLRARNYLAIERVLDAALDQHRHRLVHLVADDAAGQRTLVAARFSHDWRAFSLSKVRTRAMSRRTFLIWLLLASCWVATCMRRPNCAFSRSFNSCCNSAGFLVLKSLAFTAQPPTMRCTNVVSIGNLADA